MVTISFDEQVAQEENEVNVEVEIEGSADADGPTKVMALWLNPYTYQFTAPGEWKRNFLMGYCPNAYSVNCLAWWLIGRFIAFCPKGCGSNPALAAT